MNHTPGPWTAQFAKTSIRILSDEGETVAMVPAGRESKEADALLIASAPMLFEALLCLKNEVLMKDCQRFTVNEENAAIVAFALGVVDSVTSNLIMKKR